MQTSKMMRLEQQSVHCNSDDQVLWEAENIVKEVTALLAVIDLTIHELNDPMTVILGISELLRSQIDPDSPLAADFGTISQQINRMSEIVRGINQLNEHKILHQLNLKNSKGWLK